MAASVRFQPRRIVSPPFSRVAARGITFAMEASDKDLNLKQVEVTMLDAELVVRSSAFEEATSQQLQEITVTVWVLKDSVCARRNEYHFHRIHRHFWDCIYSLQPFVHSDEDGSNDWAFLDEEYSRKCIRMDLSSNPIIFHPGQARGIHIHVAGLLAPPPANQDVNHVVDAPPHVGLRVNNRVSRRNDKTQWPAVLRRDLGFLSFSPDPLVLHDDAEHRWDLWGKQCVLAGAIEYVGVPQIWSLENQNEYGPRFHRVARLLASSGPRALRRKNFDTNCFLKKSNPTSFLPCIYNMTMMHLAEMFGVGSNEIFAERPANHNVATSVPPLPRDCLVLILQMCGWDWFGDEHADVWRKRGYDA